MSREWGQEKKEEQVKENKEKKGAREMEREGGGGHALGGRTRG